MKTYTTIQGDTWDVIALKTLGNQLYMDKLIRANKKYMHIFEFSAGVVLNVPEITAESNKSSSILSWR